jgi:cytochrome P450
MRDRIQSLADELLTQVMHKGAMRSNPRYALPLPMTIITEILGVPRRDRDKFHKWSNAVVSLSSPNPTLRVIPNVWMFLRYLRKFFEMRRRDPQNDLATALITAEEAGDKLSRDELLAMVFLLLIAGHETTVNLIGNGVLALFEHPEAMDRLRHDPVMIKSAVEELLRYASAVFMSTERYAREDVTILGVTIPRG